MRVGTRFVFLNTLNQLLSDMSETVWDVCGLRRTPCRAAVLRCLSEQAIALSEKELTARLAGEYDRTTFYRTLKVLEQKGIIRRIVVDPSLVKFALSAELTNRVPHGHFHCKECGQVWCLEDIAPVHYLLPRGARAEDEEFIVHGRCIGCIAKAKRAALSEELA
jgi:hypothetical protein